MMKTEIPLLFGSPKDKALFTAEDYIFGIKKLKKQTLDFGIICFQLKFYKQLKRQLKPRMKNIKTYKGNAIEFIYDKNIVLCLSGIGAACSSAITEILIAFGAKKILFAGNTGALQHFEIGQILIPTKAIRDEGASYHYLNPSKHSYPDKTLVNKIEKICKDKKINYKKGSTWTTDAIYRETNRKIKKYVLEGALNVEMEASAIFAAGKYRKKPVAGVFWVSDLLLEKWHPKFESKEENKGKKKAIQIIEELVFKKQK